ncbi:MAG: hypothetical protein ACXAC2_19050 [Candidatus Kariarchaeaceae archaeon]
MHIQFHIYNVGSDKQVCCGTGSIERWNGRSDGSGVGSRVGSGVGSRVG